MEEENKNPAGAVPPAKDPGQETPPAAGAGDGHQDPPPAPKEVKMTEDEFNARLKEEKEKAAAEAKESYDKAIKTMKAAHEEEKQRLIDKHQKECDAYDDVIKQLESGKPSEKAETKPSGTPLAEALNKRNAERFKPY